MLCRKQYLKYILNMFHVMVLKRNVLETDMIHGLKNPNSFNRLDSSNKL